MFIAKYASAACLYLHAVCLYKIKYMHNTAEEWAVSNKYSCSATAHFPKRVEFRVSITAHLYYERKNAKNVVPHLSYFEIILWL